MKQRFIDKDAIIDLLGVCLVARENLFILGPPGTAKSALVQELAQRLEGKTFEYLLTRFSEPSEIFGPFDIRKLREGDLVTNTEGMLPEASVVFLDELLNANSAILNSLLSVLNERIFRRGKEIIRVPVMMVVGASNHLPEDDALGALYDRFLLRAKCDNVDDTRLTEVLDAGWQIESGPPSRDEQISMERIRELHALLPGVDLAPVRKTYVEFVLNLRRAGIDISDRRAVKFQRLIAASALLCGRAVTAPSDLWIMRYIWDTEEQREVIGALVDEVLKEAGTDEAAHPMARREDVPDPTVLDRELERILTTLSEGVPAAQGASLRDRVTRLSGRCQWVANEESRAALQAKIENAWEHLNACREGEVGSTS
jgi:MoxR-like ATPase